MKSEPVVHERPSFSSHSIASLSEPGWYRIKVQGLLDASWSDWFDDLAVEHEAAGRTLLTGLVVDQAALNGLLNKLYALGLPLLSVSRVEPDDE